jgi:DNA-binding CsgD family transcriptional regulator
MSPASLLNDALRAYERQAWSSARDGFAAAAIEAALPPDDIERYAVAAHQIGEVAECRELLARGYRVALEQDDPTRAARFAFWLGHTMLFTGEEGQAAGWFGRARNVLTDRGTDCVEWGYLMVPLGVRHVLGGDPASAHPIFLEAFAIGKRFADANLLAMAGHGLGRTLIRLGRPDEGMAYLDEAMLAVSAGEVLPLLAGDVYCGVLEACNEVFDVRRAREWTSVFSRWCESQPDLVPYRGPCLVHRVELMRLRGDWEDALEEARRACDWLSMPSSPETPADAYYELGELYRLRGDFDKAEEAYRQASRLGRAPEPGVALLWLARGNGEAAVSAVRRALDEPQISSLRRPELLTACVEIMLERGDMASARKAAEELVELSDAANVPPLHALANRAMGSVLLAEGEPQTALVNLRRSWTAWKELEATYDAACVRVLIASAYRALGDDESAAMEIDAARWVFERLGAAPALARLDVLTAPAQPSNAAQNDAGLTQRELEVLRLIVAGETNKGIAASLVISEHTVARHVQNMLQKLGLPSRTSLAAYAIEHGLLRSAG